MSAFSTLLATFSPAVYWPLDSVNGATDQSGNGRNGTGAGGITIGGDSSEPLIDGVGGSTNFDGTDDKITSTYTQVFTTGTARTWLGFGFRDTDTTVDTLWGSSGEGDKLELLNTVTNAVFTTFGGGAEGETWVGAFPTGQWVFWALVFDDPGDTAALYINGALVSSQAHTGTFFASDGNFQLGMNGANAGTSFDGKQAHVAVVHSALTAPNIAALYSAATTVPPAPPRNATGVGPGPLTVLVTSADGQQYRFGSDETSSAWVPFGINWESTVPGGWKGGGFSLRRRIDEDVQLRLFDEVEIVDEHGVTMYEGRIVKLPRQHGDDYLLNVECLGWASHLLDDKSVRKVWVDRAASNWVQPSLARVVQIGGVPLTDYQATSGFATHTDRGVTDGFSFIRFDGPADIAGGRTVLVNSTAELDYRMPPGLGVAKIMYKGTQANTTNVTSPALVTDDNEALSSAASVALTLDDTLRTATVTTPERYAAMGVAASAQHTPTAAFSRRFSKIAVYANHGLTSVPIAGEPDGFYIDDMLADVLRYACPKLNFTQGGDDPSIQRPPVVVPHAAYPEAGTAENVLLDLNKGPLWDWLVYENRTFFYRPTDPDRLCWEARMDRGIHLSLEGDDAEHAYNGALVRYEMDGVAKTAAPSASFDVTSALLGDTDPENTVNQHGYPRRWIELSISFPTIDDYAITIGAAYLAQAALPSRSGDITLRGEVEHPTKGSRPAREIRAGDWIRLSDHPADVPRRIISCRHTDDTGETVVSVGNDLNKVDALLEQLGIQTKVALG